MLTHVVEERVSVEGAVLTPLNESDVRAAARALKKDGVEAIAVSYLWSFRNPRHELRTREILAEEMPDTYVSLSTEILPQIRVYERHSTTALNAYVGPILMRYLSRLDKALAERGFKGSLLIMQSNGGVMSPEVAQRFASNTLLSGPAGGAGRRDLLRGDARLQERSSPSTWAAPRSTSRSSRMACPASRRMA